MVSSAGIIYFLMFSENNNCILVYIGWGVKLGKAKYLVEDILHKKL